MFSNAAKWLLVAATAMQCADTRATAEPVSHTLCAVRVKYHEGVKQTYVVRWTKTIVTKKSETGLACIWEIKAAVERRLYLLGPEDSLWIRETENQPIEVKAIAEKTGKGVGNCSDAAVAYDADLRSLRKTLDEAAGQWMQQDFNTVKAFLLRFGRARELDVAVPPGCELAH